jgi:hypothetical protein
MSFANVTATITMTGSSQRTTVRGSGPTLAAARAELQAKLTLTSASAVVKVVESLEVDPSTYTTNGGAFEDATLTLFKAGLPERTVHIQNVALSYALAGDLKGRIDVSNADIIAFANAYYDSDNVTGWAAIAGQFST